MKRTTGTRVAAVAATLLAAGIVTAGATNAAEAHGSSSDSTARITSQAQLHASILKAAAHESEVCEAGLSTETMGGRPPITPSPRPAVTPAATAS